MTPSQPPSTSPRPDPRLVWKLAGLVFVLSVAVFSSALRAEFVHWDDDINIVNNPHVQGLTAENLRWMFSDFEYVRRYMPLGWLSWALHCAFTGLNPALFHLGNLLLHGLNAVLVFLLLQRLLGLGLGRNDVLVGQNVIAYAAALGALSWALHPLRVEPVAWASGRLYCQALTFTLVSLLCYLSSATAAPGRRGRGWLYACSVLAFAGSLLTYPLALCLTGVLVILDAYPLRRFGAGWRGLIDAGARRLYLEKVPFILVTGLVFAVTLWSRARTTAAWDPPPTLEQFGLFSRAMQAFYIWACYVWKTWAPLDLTPLYTTLVEFDPNGPVFWGSAALVALLSVFVWRARRRWPAAPALWGCYLVLLVPVLGLTEHPHFPSDRYSYFVGVAWAALIALALALVWRHTAWRRSVWRTAAVVVAGAAVLSFHQAKIWTDSETLFEHMLAKLGDRPERQVIYYRLGVVHMGHHEYADAAEAFGKVLEIEPRSASARYQFGMALALDKRPAQAVPVLEELLHARPDYPNARVNLARACAEAGLPERAATNFALALQQEPKNARFHLAFGEFELERGAHAAAVEHFLAAKQLDPSLESVYPRLAQAHLDQGDIAAAIEADREALRSNPKMVKALLDLAWIHATSEDPRYRDAVEAVRLAERANHLTGGRHAAVLDALAAAYADAGRFDDALRAGQRALELVGTDPAKDRVQARVALYAAGQPYRRNHSQPNKP